ncbi:hypothetical protein HanIR_Chr16g0839841 [Helianthus annuus]|nr:hypothetical protein HanIR_Chr16g0839841 [Helianthus annuus]
MCCCSAVSQEKAWEKVAVWVRIPMVNMAGNLEDLLQELYVLQRNRNIRKAIHAIIRGSGRPVITHLQRVLHSQTPPLPIISTHGLCNACSLSRVFEEWRSIICCSCSSL